MNALDRRWSRAVVLAALSGFLFFYGLTAGDLYRTEGLRAAVASSCLRGESWVVPTLFGEPLYTKPPGQYVGIALFSLPMGVITEWSARLPSALAATATVFLFCWYFTRQLGRGGGLLAAVILPLSVVWLDKAPSAEIDMLHLFWVAAAVLFFLRALENDEESRPSLPWWLLSLSCVAGGCLTKWSAPVFFYATVVPLLWWRGRLRLLIGTGHVLGVGLAAAVCCGWVLLAIKDTGWDVFWDTVSREAVQRLSPSHHLEAVQSMPHHGKRLPLWADALLHPLRVFGATLPWSAFALVALWPRFGKRWNDRERRLWQALHCWAWPNLLFWSVIPEHALRHSMPLFPALSGLAAMVCLAWLRTGQSSGWFRPRRVVVSLIVVGLLAKVAWVEVVVPGRNPDRAPRAKGDLLDALVPPDQPLYVAHLKDEGILFYFGRTRPLRPSGPPVQKVADLEVLLSKPEPVYCMLNASEWAKWRHKGKADLVREIADEQGDPIVLVRTRPRNLARAEESR